MAKRKPKTYEFRTVSDMHAVPLDKVAMFCEDLRLWLTLHRMAESAGEGVRMTTPTDMFGWIDDGKHDVRVNVKLNYAQPAFSDPDATPGADRR